MQKRLIGILTTAAIIASACGGATATPAPSGAATDAPPASEPASAPPAPTMDPNDPEGLLLNWEYAPTEGVPGGAAIIGDWQAPPNLNSYYNNAFTTTQVLASTMHGLWEASASGHWKPDLAAKMPRFGDESIRQAADGSFEVDIELRPGLKWSDGTPLTLEDLKYTWEWNMDPAQVGLSAGTTGWEEITDVVVAADGLTATVQFGAPYAGFYGLLGSMVLPKHYFETIPVTEASATSMPVTPDIANVPTSGPFMFETASPSAIVLAKNPNYIGGAFGQGAYLDRVTYNYYADKNGMITDFLSGNLDAAVDMVASDFAAISGVDPSIGTAISEPAWQYEHLDMNQGPNGHPMLKEVDVRRALTQAIDKADLFAALFPGNPVPETAACSPAPPGTYWRDESVECLPFDVAAANALLDSTGWVDSNGDGNRDKDGVEAILKTCTLAGVPVRQLTLEKIAGYLSAVGIQANVELNPNMFDGWQDQPEDSSCSIYRGTYDLSLFAWVLTFDLFGNYYYSYHTDQWPDEPPHGGGNTSRFSFPEMDAALDTLSSEITTEAQVAAVQDVQRIFIEQAAEIPLYYREEVRGVATRLQNFQKNPSTSTDMWNIEDWFIQE